MDSHLLKYVEYSDFCLHGLDFCSDLIGGWLNVNWLINSFAMTKVEAVCIARC